MVRVSKQSRIEKKKYNSLRINDDFSYDFEENDGKLHDTIAVELIISDHKGKLKLI